MTRKLEDQKIRCGNCEAVFLYPEFLKAPNPFSPNEIICGCPKCKQCEHEFTVVCDEPGCTKNATCGFPTGDVNDSFGGYRSTCGDHMRSYEAAK